jgi:Protein of unknown function (DUF4231)
MSESTKPIIQMTIEEYLTERVGKQIDYYTAKSRSSKKYYTNLRIMTIILAASLPLIVSYVDKSEYIKLGVALVGVIIAIIEGIQSLKKYHENWIENRHTGEALKRERIFFQTQSGPYKDDASLSNLVTRFEALANEENSRWNENNRHEPTQPKT